MTEESGIRNIFTANHVPVVFFKGPPTVGSFDVTPEHAPYAYLYASDISAGSPATATAPATAPATIPMPSYVVTTPASRELHREIDFLSSLGLCAVEETKDGPVYHIHVFAECLYGPSKLFRRFERALQGAQAKEVFAELRELLSKYVLPGKYLSYKGQMGSEPVELTHIVAVINAFADEIK